VRSPLRLGGERTANTPTACGDYESGCDHATC
jgi:hypothetical protein